MKKQLTANDSIIVNDITRYKSNGRASSFIYLGLVFGVLYFLTVYGQQAGDAGIAATFTESVLGGSDVYTWIMGISVILNLVILLGGFLASQEIKNYSKFYSIFAIVLAVVQVIRIFVYPVQTYNATLAATGEGLFPTYSYVFMIVWLVLSAVCFAASGVLGFMGAAKRESFNKQVDAGQVDLEAAYKEGEVF